MDKRKAPFAPIIATLCAAGAFLRVALRGYEVIAYVLFGIAALLLLKMLAGATVFKVAAGLAAVLALAVCLTEVPIVGSAHTDAPPDTKFVIVLGARVDKSGAPSRSLLYRLQAAEAFLKDHPDALAVLSGGRGADEPVTEAACMAAWLTARGTDPSRLILEERSENTFQNLAYSLEAIRATGADPAGCCAVVSSSYHLFRAELMARRLGVPMTGVAAYPGNPVVALNYFIREAPAVWRLALLGS